MSRYWILISSISPLFNFLLIYLKFCYWVSDWFIINHLIFLESFEISISLFFYEEKVTNEIPIKR